MSFYFIGYKTDKRIEPLFITHPKMCRYLNKVEKTQQISFVIKDKIIPVKNRSICKKISNIMR